ncbi:unnamed protein product [Heterobilharzia americana]|nr:unnamed protein product [Heterobilharzia americana]
MVLQLTSVHDEYQTDMKHTTKHLQKQTVSNKIGLFCLLILVISRWYIGPKASILPYHSLCCNQLGGIQDAHLVLFGTRQLDVPATQ